MNPLRKALDRVEPLFHKGGKLEKLYPVYEAADTFLYTPATVTRGPSHVRDGMDLKRMMTLVIVSLIPAIGMALWNTGYQANSALVNMAARGVFAASASSAEKAGDVPTELQPLWNRTSEAQVRVDELRSQVNRVEAQVAGLVEQENRLSRRIGIAQTSEERQGADEAVGGELEAELADTRARLSRARPELENARKELAAASAALASLRVEQAPEAKGLAHQAGWRGAVLDATTGVNPDSVLSNVLHGALWFLPVYLVTVIVGGTAEAIFSIVRGHEINEGFLVTSMLFPLTLPPAIPLWQTALGILFGVVIGKEVFGGTGRNFLNPALVGRAFIFFSHGETMTGDKVWNAANAVPVVWQGAHGVDGYTSATTLNTLNNLITVNDPERTRATLANLTEATGGVTWWKAFLGTIEGSMGETSALAAVLGAAFMLVVGIASWRIMLGCVIGLVGASGLLYAAAQAGYSENAMWLLPPWWHLVVGGFAFGAVWMATDPVSAAMSRAGMWWYGVLIGVVTMIVRAINPAYPEGIMLAILFGNVFAPLIDYFVVQANIKRRLARNVA